MRFMGVCVVALAFAGACAAEVELSLNIKGTAQEIATVLQLLQQAGLAGGAGGMQVQVESTFARPEDTSAPAPTTPPPPAAPTTPAMGSAIVAPEAVAPGKAAVLSVQVLDPDRKIDTIAAVVGDRVLMGDLHDNGMNGDATAGDGRWSLLLSVPAGTPEGSYPVVFQAFDAQGAAVALPGADGAPVVVQAASAITIRRQ